MGAESLPSRVTSTSLHTSTPPAPTKTHLPTVTPSPSQTLTHTVTASPTNTTTPTPLACWKLGGRVLTGSLRTNLLRLPMDYRVYLPPCYDQQPERRYAVLYLIHGQSFTEDQWDRLGADETADKLIAAGEISPFIIVMPRDRYGGQPTENNFARVVVEELMPYIDQTYRTLPDRIHRAVGGLSRGAGWAVHLAIVNWELFGALGAHSPAIFYTDAQSMRPWLDAIPKEAFPRVFIDIGDRDRPEIMDAAIWFEKLLDERDIAHEWHLLSGFHTETYWQAHIELYIRWYAQDW